MAGEGVGVELGRMGLGEGARGVDHLWALKIVNFDVALVW